MNNVKRLNKNLVPKGTIAGVTIYQDSTDEKLYYKDINGKTILLTNEEIDLSGYLPLTGGTLTGAIKYDTLYDGRAYSTTINGLTTLLLSHTRESDIGAGYGVVIECTNGLLQSQIQLFGSYISIMPPLGELNNLRIYNLNTYANNADAISAGEGVDTVYKTATGELRIVV